MIWHVIYEEGHSNPYREMVHGPYSDDMRTLVQNNRAGAAITSEGAGDPAFSYTNSKFVFELHVGGQATFGGDPSRWQTGNMGSVAAKR